MAMDTEYSARRWHASCPLTAFSPFGENIRNAYAYCIGDPINSYDPSGHVPIFRTKAYYRTKATRALNEDPNLKKQYGDILEADSARKKHYKAIYRIYKLEKSSRAYEATHIEELQRGDYGIDVQTALYERASRRPTSDSGDFPLAASMDSEDALKYHDKQRRIEKYVARLEEFERDLHSAQLAAIEIRNQS
ncbi:hypothetical protein [Pseudomonas sp. CM25]|nr:hypothetical protein [Pseudomonas sp. CM25]